MKPITIVGLTWLLWIVAKGEAAKYWSFATVRGGGSAATPNAAGASASNAPAATGASNTTMPSSNASNTVNTGTMVSTLQNILQLASGQ